MANQRIQVEDLDFDAIKTNLKNFLSSQDTFKDYDFEGSALNVLLDVLSYNTHYNALYTNLALNESFLDTATKRSSVVSLAKQLGYITRSSRGASAIINVTVSGSASSSNVLTLPKNSAFKTVINGKEYNFFTVADITTPKVNNTYTFNNVTIKEGQLLTFRYTASNTTRYIIPNKDVDLSTLTVKISKQGQTGFELYNREDGILNLTKDSAVYFIREIDDELYEISFGDDTIGKSVQPGSIITFDYFVTSKDAANSNVPVTFLYQGANLGGLVGVTSVLNPNGGALNEDLDSVRYNAPRAYAAQNRGVTVEDYKTLITATYPNIDAVNVWGGEDNVPPSYGKVFISIKPSNTLTLTDAEKEVILTDVLKSRNIVSITPELVDPSFVYLDITSTVYYNPKTTNKDSETIKTIVTDAINAFGTNNLGKFTSVFRMSNLSTAIDRSDASIVSNVTTTKLQVRKTPAYDVSVKYQLNLEYPIFNAQAPGISVNTTGFYILNSDKLHFIDDDGFGNLRLIRYDDGEKIIVNPTIGTITYSNGTLTINSLHVTMVDSSHGSEDIQFTLKPESYDAASIRNQIIDISNITVSVIADKVATGEAAGGANYIFSSSRS